MTKHPTIVPLPNREPTGQGANDLLLVLGVAAFVLGVAMVSQGVLLSQPAAHLVPTTHAALGRVERLVPAPDERPVATTPPADLVPLTPVTSPASQRRDPGGALSVPRVAPSSATCVWGSWRWRCSSEASFWGDMSRHPSRPFRRNTVCWRVPRHRSPLLRHRRPPLHNRKILAVERGGAVPRKPPRLVGRARPVPVSPLPGIDRRELPSDNERASSYCSSDSVLGIVWLDVVSGRPCQHLILSMPRDRQPTSNPPSVAQSGPSHD